MERFRLPDDFRKAYVFRLHHCQRTMSMRGAEKRRDRRRADAAPISMILT
jgi:hypothetical protein